MFRGNRILVQLRFVSEISVILQGTCAFSLIKFHLPFSQYRSNDFSLPLTTLSIRTLWSEFKTKIKIKVANGAKTDFWKDEWHESGRLENLFPDIHALVSHQQKTIVEFWTPHGWRFNFRRHLNDWEIQRVADFLNTIEQFNGLEVGQYTL